MCGLGHLLWQDHLRVRYIAYLRGKVREDFGTVGRRQVSEINEINRRLVEKAQKIASLGNWDWNVKDNSLWWSDGIYTIFGVSQNESVPTYEAFLNFVHPNDREFVTTSVNRSLYENKPYNINHRITLCTAGSRTGGDILRRKWSADTNARYGSGCH